MKRILFVLLAWTVVPAAASAQVVWDAPAMIRPGAPSGLSLFLLEPHDPDRELQNLVPG